MGDSQNEGKPIHGTSEASHPWLGRLALAAAIAAFAYFVAHCVFVITGPQQRLMAWLYDDALYYAIVAQHFSTQHISSFDGVTLTTGYHPLWMWVCSFVYGLRNRLDLTYLRLCMGLSATIAAILLVAALRVAVRRRGSGWLWALALAATSYSAFNNGLTIMEWPLVVLFWMALHAFLLRSLRTSSEAASGPGWASLATAFLLGVGGCLARTDFGLIPFVYLVAGMIFAVRFRNSRPARTAAAALMGSAAGLVLVFGYNRRMTGAWLQQSAQVKHAFASLTSPFNPVPALWQFGRTLLYLPPLDMDADHRANALKLGLVFVVLVGSPLCIWMIFSRKRQCQRVLRAIKHDPLATFELSSAFVGVLSYLCVYSLNSQATYGWYTATVTGFIVILAARLLSSIPARVSAAIALPLLVLNIAGSTLGGTARGQYMENEAGMAMRRDHAGAVMGGGDVGKPSFYNNGTMINFDGLMNNEVVPYLLAGRFPCYVLKRRVAYVSDVGTITIPLTNAERARKMLPPIPWNTYFMPVDSVAPDGTAATYLKTNFEAIRDSGECQNQ